MMMNLFTVMVLLMFLISHTLTVVIIIILSKKIFIMPLLLFHVILINIRKYNLILIQGLVQNSNSSAIYIFNIYG